MGKINGVPGNKMTIWCSYRFTFEQKGIFYSNGLNFVKIGNYFCEFSKDLCTNGIKPPNISKTS